MTLEFLPGLINDFGTGIPRAVVARTLIGVLIAAHGVALALIAARSLVRHDRRRYGPTWRAICNELGVHRLERKLLERVARCGRAPHPACLVISRGSFDEAVRRADLPGSAGSVLSAVRGRVFD